MIYFVPCFVLLTIDSLYTMRDTQVNILMPFMAHRISSALALTR